MESSSYKFCESCYKKISKSTYYHSHHNGRCVSKKKKSMLKPSQGSHFDGFSVLGNSTDEGNPSFSDSENNDTSDAFEDDCSIEEEQVEFTETNELPEDFNYENNQNSSIPESRSITRSIVSSVLKWQSIHFISDSCLLSLLLLLKHIFFTICSFIPSDMLNALIESFPTTLYSARKLIGLDRDDFSKYVACEECNSIYKMDEAVVTLQGKKISKRCSYVPFKDHPQLRFRSPCNTTLLKSLVNFSGDKECLYPKKVYCYRGIKKSMSDLLKQPGFLKLLLQKPETSRDNQIMSDIYDGKMYREFEDCNGSKFFADPRNIGLMLNFDFFNPFENSQYSLGVLYAVILNIPRASRFLLENVIVIGIIPGPSEPSKNINSFLQPFVQELLEFWSYGVQLEEEDGSKPLYRFALICISSDLPALRKCGGFLSYMARKGCSKCHTSFEFGDERDLGFLRGDWISRDGNEHKEMGFFQLSCTTKEKVANAEKETGVRYSELFKLPYFDPVQMHVVDPMHNLFLGVAKHTFTTWLETGKLRENDFQKIEEKQNSLRLPSDIGRIAVSVCKHHKMLKADEWKHWVMIYSIYCLRGILPARDMNIWSMFVSACHLICRPIVSLADADQAHTLLKMFCVQFQNRYGSQNIVPNMHMMLHLRECIEFYGPIYSFWCFGFERYNGILGLYHTNSHSIAIQIMRKFVARSKLHSVDKILTTTASKTVSFATLMKLVTCINIETVNVSCFSFSCETVVSPVRQITLDESTTDGLLNMFHNYCNMEDVLRISPIGNTVSRLKVGNQILCNNHYRGSSPYSYVIARWCYGKGQGYSLRPAVIREIYKIKAVSESTKNEYWVAKLDWFRRHEKVDFYGFNCQTKIWCTMMEPLNVNSLIPVRFIKGRFLYCKEEVKFGNFTDSVTIVIPLPVKSVM